MYYKLQGQVSKVTTWKLRLIAKLLCTCRKLRLLNLMAMTVAVSVHAQYKIGQEQPRTTCTTSRVFKLQCIRNCHILKIFVCNSAFLSPVPDGWESYEWGSWSTLVYAQIPLDLSCRRPGPRLFNLSKTCHRLVCDLSKTCFKPDANFFIDTPEAT